MQNTYPRTQTMLALCIQKFKIFFKKRIFGGNECGESSLGEPWGQSEKSGCGLRRSKAGARGAWERDIPQRMVETMRSSPHPGRLQEEARGEGKLGERGWRPRLSPSMLLAPPH